jgi:hypothetical protein
MSVEYTKRPSKPVFRHGRCIEVDELVPVTSSARRKRKHKAFESQFVQVPKGWVAALSQTTSLATYRLALIILDKDFERRQTGREFVLSARVTGMSQTTRRRAAQELIRLKLIRLEPGTAGNGAPRCWLSVSKGFETASSAN